MIRPDSAAELKFPLSMLLRDGTAPELLTFEGGLPCLMLFTSEARLEAYFAEHVAPVRGTGEYFVGPCPTAEFLADLLELRIVELRANNVHHLAIDPTPDRTVAIPVADLIARLRAEG